jgi:Aspartyl protease
MSGFIQSSNAQGDNAHGSQPQDGSIRIPFELDRNHILLPVEINGKRFRLVLDTGMPANGALLHGIRDRAELGFEFISQMPVGGVGTGGAKMADVAANITLKLGDLELKGQTVIVMPFDETRALNFESNGVIGWEIFSKFAVKIDYDKKELVLAKPGKIPIPHSATKIPLVIEHNFPWLECSATMLSGETVPMKLVLDMGASHAISLNVGSHPGIVLPDGAVEARLGRGLSGPVYGHIGRIKEFRLGNQVLKDVLSSFQSGPRSGPAALEREGNLGGDLLRRFNIIIDYFSKSLYLEPNSRSKEPFEFDMTGLEFTRMGADVLRIDRIYPQSPAYDAGLKEGYEISEIDGRPVDQLKLSDLAGKFRTEGRQIKLLVSDLNGNSREVVLTLRRLI